MITFNEILENVESLSIEDKFSLSEIIKKRAIEERRQEILKIANESYKEYIDGKIVPMTVSEFFEELAN